jgi:hypothetical protein
METLRDSWRSAGKRFGQGSGPVILIALFLAGMDVLLFVTGSGKVEKAIVTAFLVLVVYGGWAQRTSRALVAQMTAKAAVSPRLDPSAQPAPAVESTPSLPIPPFKIEIFTNATLPPLSAAAEELIARSQHIYRASLVLHRTWVWYLLAVNVATALVNTESYPAPGGLLLFLIAAAAFLSVATGRRASRHSLMQVAWFVLHAACLGVTVFVGAMSLLKVIEGGFQSADLIRLALAVAGLLIYVFLFRRAVNRLRQDVLSHRPLELLFLWVFGTTYRLNSLFLGLGALWRSLGSLQLLRGGETVAWGSDPIRVARGRSQDVIALTPEQVDARIASFRQTPHPWYCVYETNTLLCGDQSWKHAVARLLHDTDLVLMDLSSFSPKNAGCTYEIGQLIDKMDRSRFLLLVDETTDMDFLTKALQTAWTAMAPTSPNRRPDAGPIRLFRLEKEYEERADGGPPANLGGDSELLKTKRSPVI